MKRIIDAAAVMIAVIMMVMPSSAQDKVWLDEIDLVEMTTGWGAAQSKKSVEGNPLKIAGKTYQRGVGTHAISMFEVKLDGKGIAFDAVVGLDDEALEGGSVKFIVFSGEKRLAESKVLRKGDVDKLHVDLNGIDKINLFVCDARDGATYDHADWCDAFFTMQSGANPVPVVRYMTQLGRLSPPIAAEPRINGPRVYGVRPGHDIIYRLPVSGERPMRMSAHNLPTGTAFDEATGILTGKIVDRGDYEITFRAENAKGVAERKFTVKVGDKIALTPPMGWNSWNCFAHRVTEKDIRNAVDVFDKSELANHGWSYVNIDDFWQNSVKPTDDPTITGPQRKPDGTINPNSRFPSMKDLADYAHSKGFKIGLYSSPGPETCGGCAGSWKHEWLDAKTYAEWGYDYLKYDWCGYGKVAADVNSESSLAHNTLPYRLMGEALAAQNRDIVLSICQYGMCNVSTWGENVGGQCWRTTGDINDTWRSMSDILDIQAELWPYAKPGAWNDPDMLVVGNLGWGNIHPSLLKPNEQYTHMSFWAIFCAPLLIGCDMTQIDDFTMSLLTNDEVLETNQDPLGAAAARVAKNASKGLEVWAKPMSDGSLVFALYNKSFDDADITVDFKALGVEGEWKVRDLWRQQDVGICQGHYTATVYPHATQLVRMFPVDKSSRLREGLRDIRDNSVYIQFAKTRPVDKPGAQVSKPCEDCPRK